MKKIPDISNLVKKTDYDAKTSSIECKCFSTADYNKFTSQKLDTKIKQKELVDECSIVGFINNVDLNEKVKTKAELKTIWFKLFDW